ncbi:hypothetical protein CPLU01_12057 [Colletotrichum plurivorum]|uniref:LPXTG-domain-containing protein n=1 Tax=Colletotrichum plurivorum TaxID=2175906 RepID=A0A8H6K0V2_9PEZI|nr:hypothetical protein CPLU01_12057 [Colletotrichum plurivorum]
MAVTPLTVTASGRPTVYYPLPTPWPLGPGCASRTYRQAELGKIPRVGPYYGMHLDSDAKTCYPPHVTSWWFQTEGQPTSIALRPTFACPEAYTAAQTLLEAGGVQHVYCCPSSYTFHVPQPTKPVFPSQCLSTATAGQTITYDSLTPAEDGMTYFPTSSVVKSEVVSIWVVPVNGYNFPITSPSVASTGATITSTFTSAIASANKSESPTSSTAELAKETGGEDSTPAGTPLAMTVGVSVGVVFAVLALIGGAFMLWRRRWRRNRRSSNTENKVSEVEGQPVVKPLSFHGREFELSAEVAPQRNYELYGDNVRTKSTVYELPGSREKG